MAARDAIEWRDIVYDIPIPKRSRKAQAAAADPLNAEESWTPTEKEPAAPSSASADTSPSTALKTPTPASPPAAARTRRILDGISGHVNNGEMVAILGATGAGKTTLLDVLTARLGPTGKLGGNVTFRGKPRDPGTWKRTVGYVEQDDVMIGCLTVRETFEYAARLRLNRSKFGKADREERVERIIDMLRLEKCADTRIGGGGTRGVSGGERKRAAIGTELVSDVQLLVLDEPTSGLDAFAALNLVNNVKQVAKDRDIACIMTVHQPSWSIFCKYDRVMLLARGKIYYHGPPRDTIEYFASIGHTVPEGVNPADHFISIAENFSRSKEGEESIQRLIDNWAEKGEEWMARFDSLKSQAQADQAQAAQDQSSKPPSTTDTHTPLAGWPLPWLTELGVLTERHIKQILRDPTTLYGTIGQTVVLLIIIGFAFFRLGYSQADVLARIGILFFLPVNASFAVLFPVLAQFPLQRQVMIRERSAGSYRTSSFYVSKVLCEVPNAILQKALYYIIIYWMVGLRESAAAFFIFLGINAIQLTTSVGLGLAIGAASPTIELGNIIAPMVNVIFFLFGGNVLPSPPPWFVWLRWISPITYSYIALSVNEFNDATFECNNDGAQCYRTGQDVLNQYNLTTFTIAECIGFLAAITCVFVFAGYVFLRFTAHPRFRYVEHSK